jgi:predicted house-cleaning noncanonical NTP pyrophosphatase (MazG superfamily)
MNLPKLVRNRIPNLIKSGGKSPVIHIASEEEYEKKLKEKLLEEVNEFLNSGDEIELADILEVIYALCDLYGWDRSQIELLREKIVEKKGDFSKKIILEKIIG